jgi:hypothetical protein
MPTRHLRRALIVAGTFAAALLFFVGGIALRVLIGPISLGPFAGAIEDALNASVSGLVIRFDQAELEWSRDTGKVNLVVLGTRVFDLQDHIIAQAPKADIDFDAAALIMGRIEPKEFTLVGVQLTAIRKLDGTLHIGFDVADTNNDALEAILDTLNTGGPRMLDHFAIRDARLAFRDEASGFFLVAPRAALDIAAKGTGLHAAVDADIEVSGKPAQLVADADLTDSGMPRNLGVTLHHFDVAALAENSPSFAALRMAPLIADVKANAVIEGDAIQQVVFDADGTGDLGDTTAGGISIPVGKFHLGGRYDAAGSQVTIDDFTIDGEHARGKAIGSFVLSKDDSGVRSIAGTFEARALYFDTPALFAAPVSFNGIVFTGAFDRQSKILTATRVAITGGPLALDVSGSADFSGAGAPGLAIKGTMPQLPVRDLIKYWPVRAAAGAREWLDTNVASGLIGPLKADVEIAPGALDKEILPENAVSLTFPFSNVTVSYIKGMTPISEGSGTGALTGDTFHGTVSSANIGTLPLSSGDIRIAELHTHGSPAIIHAHVEGGMPEILALLNEDPLDYPKRFGIDPTKVGGRAKIDVDFAIPTLKDVSVDQLTIGVKAQTTELSLPLDERRTLSNANANLVIDGKGLVADGTGSISDVPVSIRWTENFNPGEGAASTHVDLGGVVDDAARKRLGIDLDWLTGPVKSQLALDGHRGKLETGTLQADMSGAAMTVRAIDWTKPAGAPATLTTAIQFGDAHATSFTNFSLVAGAAQFHGAMDLNGNGDLVRANFDKVVVGAGDDFNARWQLTPDGVQSLSVQGKSIDISRLFTSAGKKPAAPAQNPDATDFSHPLHVDAKLDRLMLRSDQALRNILLTADFGPDERVDRFALAADGPLKGKVAGGLSASGDARKLTITADDGGALIAAFTGFNSIRGGSLVLGADFTPVRGQAAAKTVASDYKGTLELKNFTLVNQPFLARFFAIGSLDGPLRLLQGQGIAFDHLTVPFSARAKRVTVTDGRASGPAIGISFDGLVDRAADQVDLSGSLVPVYGLNSMLGNVPIVGNLLVSKPGEGIFGLTYTVKGPVDEPGLSINPLSALAPGIFRRIFEFAPPKEAAPQAAAPAAPAPKAN